MKSQKPFKKRFWKLVFLLAALFFVMLGLRILYGYMYSEIRNTKTDEQEVFSSFGEVKKNYASEKSSYSKESKADYVEQNQGKSDESSSEAKYEKTATLKSKTTQFDKDEASIRKVVKEFKAAIQYEKKSGNKGNRELRLLIGVTPELFDSCYVAVQKIGSIKFNEVVKVDKTNDYRTLMAQKESYEKILASLNELKTKSGEIKDYISLHDKILEIETSMQNIGVKLGDYKSEEQFCTIKFSLLEGTAEIKTDSFWLRLQIALKWTMIYYTLLICSMAGIALAAYLMLLIIDKVTVLKERWMPRNKQ
jgi:hypothetical protein